MNRRTLSIVSSSVRGRLALLVLAVLVPALLLAVALTFRAYQNERAAVADKLVSAARAIAGVVDGEIDEARMLLKTLSSSGAMQREDFASLDATARQTLEGDGRWVIVLDVNGNQLVHTLVPYGTPVPPFVREPEFAAAMLQDRAFVSNLREGPVAKSLIVHASVPVKVGGTFKYSVSVVTRPSTLDDAMNVERYMPGSVISVIDRNGITIARSHSPEEFIGGPATPDMVKATSERAEGIVDSVTLEGIPVLSAFSRAASGWRVLIGVPKDQLYAPARKLLLLGLGGAVMITIIVGAMALWIGRSVVRGVDALSADAVALGQGRVPPEVSSGLDETDMVAAAMRQTAETLLRRTRMLEVLNRANSELAAERNLKTIARHIVEAGREASGAACGTCFFIAEGPDGQPEPGFVHTEDGGNAFRAPAETEYATLFPASGNGSALRIVDLTTTTPDSSAGVHRRLLTGARPLRSYLAVPIRSGDHQVIGGLVLGHPERDAFTLEDEEAVIGLAAGAAIAFDNAKLYFALGRELDAKSKVEAELRLTQLDLERKVEERTASLREAIAQMEEFSYSVSHDLRSPLRAMKAYATALLEDHGPQLDDQARHYLDRISRSAERMDRLTRDVLSYSRIGQGQLPLEAVDLEKIIRGAVDHYSELQTTVADVRVVTPLLPVRAHEPSLTQCLANLLINAAKFVKPGERPQITVRTEARGDRIRIWVEDRGIGVPARFHDRLFRMFERVASENAYEGTGVGLAIVRKAAQKMGGTCGVESDGVTGSRFWIELASEVARADPAEGVRKMTALRPPAVSDSGIITPAFAQGSLLVRPVSYVTNEPSPFHDW